MVCDYCKQQDVATSSSRQTPVRCQRTRVKLTTKKSRRSDAEQLAELREAARRALTWTEELMLAKPLSEQGDAVTASLRAALNPSHSQEGDTDES